MRSHPAQLLKQLLRLRRGAPNVIVERAGQRTKLAVFAICCVWAVPVCGQPPAHSFVELQNRLKVGETIIVTDNGGHDTAGRLSDISPTSLGVRVGRTTRSFSTSEVQRVQRRHADSLVNGLLIGAAVGAGYGLYWYLKDPNECANKVCGSDLMGGMVVGAVVGLSIDAAIKKNVVLYLAPASRTSARAGIAIRW